MKRGFKLFLLMVCSALLLASYSPVAHGQTVEPDITDQSITLHLTNATLLYAISTLCVDHRVPVGLEIAPGERNEATLNIDAQQARLRDILDQITAQEPAYKWEVRDGVINLVPVSERDKFFEKLLNTPVNLFAPAKGLTKFEIRDAILDLPEVKEQLTASKISASHRSYFNRPSIYSNPDVDLNISNTDVRGVLNKVIKDSEHKLWVLDWTDKKKQVIEISF